LGLFVNSETPSAIESLAARLGVTAQVMAVYAYPEGEWNQFTFAPGAGYRLLLGVGAVSPAQATSIGDNLVAEGYSNTIIRIMWEMNGSWMPWSAPAKQSVTQYITAFRAIVDAFRAVPGNEFLICWNPNALTSFDATFPGARFVDIVGIDIFDGGDLVRDVPAIISFAEWGLRGVDDPAFINSMVSLIKNPANRVVLQSYFSAPNAIDSDITQFPKSMAAYTKAFSQGGNCQHDRPNC
jgi:hypothetical protein